jgi:hypothetical protein
LQVAAIGCGGDDDGAGRADAAAARDDADPEGDAGISACGDKLAYEPSLFTDGLVVAATLDGDHLFFLTEKDLNEVRLHRVDLEDGTGEVLSVLYSDQQLSLTFHIVVGGDYVYIGNGEGVWRVGSGGGEPVRITADAVEDIAADETHVYWSGFSGSVKRFSTEDGASEEVFATTEEAAALAKVAIDGTHVYWNDRTDLWRRSKSGGDPDPLGQAATIDETSPVDDLIVAGDHLYWVSADSDGYALLSRMKVTGGPSEEVAESSDASGVILQPLLVAKNFLYWAEIHSGIQRVPITGGEPVDVAPWSDAFTQSGNSLLYVVDGVDGIRALPLAGCPE